MLKHIQADEWQTISSSAKAKMEEKKEEVKAGGEQAGIDSRP
jgi:hypothetical protein